MRVPWDVHVGNDMKYILLFWMISSLFWGGTAYSATPVFCNGITTAEINSCADYLLKKSDTRLNEKYKELLTTLPLSAKDFLIKSQRLWIVYRDKTCQIYQPDSSGRYPDGSYAGNEAYAEKRKCETDITESRVIELETILNDGVNQSYYKARKYISERFYNNDPESLAQEILEVARQNKSWMSYAAKSCKLNNFLYSEESHSCIARLAFFDQPVPEKQ